MILEHFEEENSMGSSFVFELVKSNKAIARILVHSRGNLAIVVYLLSGASTISSFRYKEKSWSVAERHAFCRGVLSRSHIRATNSKPSMCTKQLRLHGGSQHDFK
jgi:hypothetical protein